MTEYSSIVNENDEEIGKAVYEEAVAKKPTRRIVHVLIFNSEGKMALQMRSKHKSFRPEYWCTSVGGHVRFGENYKEAAIREMQEEIGIEKEPEFLGKHHCSDGNGQEMFLSVFKLVFGGPFQINPEEVERIEFFSMDVIDEMIKNGEKFHPELLFLLKRFYANNEKEND